MLRNLAAYVVLLALFPLFDFAWIGFLARGLYQREIGALLTPQPRLGAAAAFYLLYAAGVLLFAVRPGLEQADWRGTAGMAALLGLFAYATYDLTNLATLKGFTARIGIVDMAWGAFMTAVIASAARVVARRFS